MFNSMFNSFFFPASSNNGATAAPIPAPVHQQNWMGGYPPGQSFNPNIIPQQAHPQYPAVQQAQPQWELTDSNLADFQQRLVHLHHAQSCEDSNANPPRVCRVSRKCHELVALLIHVQTCQNAANCIVPDCGVTYCIMEHNRTCTTACCLLCSPVNETKKRKQLRQGSMIQVSRGGSGSSVGSQERQRTPSPGLSIQQQNHVQQIYQAPVAMLPPVAPVQPSWSTPNPPFVPQYNINPNVPNVNINAYSRPITQNPPMGIAQAQVPQYVPQAPAPFPTSHQQQLGGNMMYPTSVGPSPQHSISSFSTQTSASFSEEPNGAIAGLLEEDIFALDRLFSWYCCKCGKSMMEGYRHHCNTCGINFCTDCLQITLSIQGYGHEHPLASIPL